VALLVLLPGAAGARVVAADFSAAAHHSLDRLALAGTGHTGLFEFATLAALESLFKVIDGSGDRTGRTMTVSIGSAARAKGRNSCRTALVLILRTSGG
jgi:hypothetical protein